MHQELCERLLASPGQEDLCFAVWYPSSGTTRSTSLIQRLILPIEGDRELHGNVSFLPQYFERALAEAIDVGGGLCFIHSHLGPGWQGMSDPDVIAEERMAPAVLGATGLPLLGMTLGTDGAWSARRWLRVGSRQYERVWCDRVRVVGDYLELTYHPILSPETAIAEALDRTVSAWGPKVQSDLARMVVGVVGAGSVGSIIIEALARMGVSEIYLIDFDAIEDVNRDRLLHANRTNIGLAKVKVIARAVMSSATSTSFKVTPVEYSIVEETGFRAALDCDLLFSCVDRPWGRSVLNGIAYTHLIPVVDGGIRAEPIPGLKGLRRADIRAHTASPNRACLECIGQYDSGHVSVERDGYLDDPSYIAGLPLNHPFRQKQNVFAFSLHAAGLQISQMISLIARPLGIGNPGTALYHLVTNNLDSESPICRTQCLYPSLTAKGDAVGIAFTGTHPVAERARNLRRHSNQPVTLAPRVLAWIKNLVRKCRMSVG
jgi:molybdopterin/thiamine biosynthesis adenylyltransferase